MEKHLCIGHSYIRRLFNHCTHHIHYNMNLEHSTVHFTGSVNGKNLSYAWQMEQWLDQHGHAISDFSTALVEIGTNDLMNEISYLQPVKLAEYVYRLAMKMRILGVRRVAVMQILFRKGKGAIPRWCRVSNDARTRRHFQNEFNKAVVIYNRHLAYLCANGDGTIVFRRQQGLIESWYNKILGDGCHLTPSAMVTYFNNIRSVLVCEGMKARQ